MSRSIKMLALASSVVISSSSWGYVIQGGTYHGVDVGGLDTFLKSTNSLANSSPSTELNWANQTLNPATTFATGNGDTSKTDPATYYATDTAGVYAINLKYAPQYFLLKNATWWALYENNDDADWGVFSVADLDSGMNINGSGKLSHFVEYGEYEDPTCEVDCDPPVEVPEPATLGLLALGLVGLGVARRRQS